MLVPYCKLSVLADNSDIHGGESLFSKSVSIFHYFEYFQL